MSQKIPEILKKIKFNNLQFSHIAYALNEDEYKKFHTFENDIYLSVDAMGSTLSTMNFTVKDIFNTYLFATEMGSEKWKGFNPGNNARCITKLLWQGANLVGKTVTSEFAVHEETSAVNPWNSNKTVGTSSAGAAVNILIDGCDFALATQTAGSIGRPASYCGVKAFKPTYGMISRTGVLKTCDPFDTVGYFVKDFDVAEKVSKALFEVGKNYPLNDPRVAREFKKIGVLKHSAVMNDKDVDDRFARLIDELSHDFEIETLDIPSEFENIHDQQALIYSYSLSYYFARELTDSESVSESFKQTVDFARSVSSADFMDALELHAKHIDKFSKWLTSANVDVVLAPSAFGVAPNRSGKEERDMNLFYTYMHLPIAYFPMWFNEKKRLPHGLSFIANLKDDYNLLSFMKTIESKYPVNEGHLYNENAGV
jgi:Asp-tRNA(Asn)/Glu-tRNA(Gln) amidotransferase A subunit family amidase